MTEIGEYILLYAGMSVIVVGQFFSQKEQEERQIISGTKLYDG